MRGAERKSDRWAPLQPYFTPPSQYRDDFRGYRPPLPFADCRKDESAADGTRRRREIRDEWMKLLGPWPELLREPQIKILASERRENFTQHRVHVEIYPGGKFTEGHLLVPDGKGPFPAVLVTFY